MSAVTEAIILAGGLGTRLRSVVKDVPKPMALVQEKPFLETLLNYYARQGITRFILSVGHLAHIIENHFGHDWQGLSIEYCLETNPLGTGGGILQASTLLKNRHQACLALNGDTFFAINLAKLAQFHETKEAAISLSCFNSNDIERYMGLTTDQTDRITQFNVKSHAGQCLVNGGAYLINPSLLHELAKEPITPQSWENDTLPKLLEEHYRLYAHAIAADFIDIGIPDDYARAQYFDFGKPS